MCIRDRAWNDLTTAPIPKWTAGRIREAEKALQRRPFEQWREVFKRINASPFLRGLKGDWRADIDWALRPGGTKPESALKVLEGAYDDGVMRLEPAPALPSCAVCGGVAPAQVWGVDLCHQCAATVPPEVDDLASAARWVEERAA